MKQNPDFKINNLGKATIKSPIILSNVHGDNIVNYVSNDEFILQNIAISERENISKDDILEKAGPREKIFFDPAKVNAGIITCGGLCPGLNDVIRSIVMTLWYRYNVKRIFGIRYGFKGFLPEFNLPVLNLTADMVSDIHQQGGTILGSSRGSGDKVDEILDSIERMNLNILFVIGGDGSQRGSRDIANEALKRGLKLSVVGVPKTIDNDLNMIQKTFGFETAVSEAVKAVAAAHVEAKAAQNGIGMVKVMGRDAGFIAAYTALAQNDVNYVLIPEVPFHLDGYNGLYTHLEQRLKNRNHAVILVAEGAGQNLLKRNNNTDASGNKKLGDIGTYLKDTITSHFKSKQIETTLKYIDPSYMIRSAPANPNDSLFCERLGANAVHAAMSGKTNMLISCINDVLVHLPIEQAVKQKKRIDPESPLWRDVLEATGQPVMMINASVVE